MEINISYVLSGVALFLIFIIALLNTLGIEKANSRRCLGILLSLAAAWIALLSLDIVLPRMVSIIASVGLIAFEMWYLCQGVDTPKVAKKTVVVAPEPKEDGFLEVVRDIIDEGDTQESDALTESIERWVAEKGFLSSGVTIQRLAAEIKTNRTYLSGYINTTYNTSFRDWISSHRVAEAQVLLRSERDSSVADIAHRVGFASVASFSRAFTREVGVSPAAWRGNCSDEGHETAQV